MQGNAEKNISCYYICSFTLWNKFSAKLVRSSKFYFDLKSCLISRREKKLTLCNSKYCNSLEIS